MATLVSNPTFGEDNKNSRKRLRKSSMNALGCNISGSTDPLGTPLGTPLSTPLGTPLSTPLSTPLMTPLNTPSGSPLALGSESEIYTPAKLFEKLNILESEATHVLESMKNEAKATQVLDSMKNVNKRLRPRLNPESHSSYVSRQIATRTPPRSSRPKNASSALGGLYARLSWIINEGIKTNSGLDALTLAIIDDWDRPKIGSTVDSAGPIRIIVSNRLKIKNRFETFVNGLAKVLENNFFTNDLTGKIDFNIWSDDNHNLGAELNIKVDTKIDGRSYQFDLKIIVNVNSAYDIGSCNRYDWSTIRWHDRAIKLEKMEVNNNSCIII